VRESTDGSQTRTDARDARDWTTTNVRTYGTHTRLIGQRSSPSSPSSAATAADRRTRRGARFADGASRGVSARRESLGVHAPEDYRNRHGRRDDDGGVRRGRRHRHRRHRRRRSAPGVARVVPELGPGQPSVRVHVCVFVDFVFGATALAVEAFLGIQGGRRTGDVGFRARDAGFGAGWRTSGATGARLRRR